MLDEQYEIKEIVFEDIQELRSLTPEGWGDIGNHFKDYFSWGCTKPIKIEVNHKIVAVGCAIFHQDTAWLGHIIVKEEYRRRGFGAKIVKALLEYCRTYGVSTISLVASRMGEPLYTGFGFEKVGTYIYLKGKPIVTQQHQNICKATTNDFNEIMTLDEYISGEKRGQIIGKYLEGSYLYKEDGVIKGVFSPLLGQGQIIATEKEAGLALLDVALSLKEEFAVPEENSDALNYLKEKGFVPFSKGTRMSLGNKCRVKMEQIYNRIGGNLG